MTIDRIAIATINVPEFPTVSMGECDAYIQVSAFLKYFYFEIQYQSTNVYDDS